MQVCVQVCTLVRFKVVKYQPIYPYTESVKTTIYGKRKYSNTWPKYSIIWDMKIRQTQKRYSYIMRYMLSIIRKENKKPWENVFSIIYQTYKPTVIRN